MKSITKILSLGLVFSMLASVFCIGAKATTEFTDVPADAYYYDAVQWAVSERITSGTSSTTFSPNQACTRAQFVTFLWRMVGRPEPVTTTCVYQDVIAGQYYYKAVLWAAETGITSGTSSTSFSPNAYCTRGQVLTFLWRAAGKPTPQAQTCTYTDVSSGQYYYKPVLWAVENQITAGNNTSTFSPNANCTRADTVTFLYQSSSNTDIVNCAIEKTAYNKLMSLKTDYPEGMAWGSDKAYIKYAPGTIYNNSGCAAFAFEISDIVFGEDAPITTHRDFDQVRVGDIIYYSSFGSGHFVVVLTKDANGFTVVEGNYNGIVHWDRSVYKWYLTRSSSQGHIDTRYQN